MLKTDTAQALARHVVSQAVHSELVAVREELEKLSLTGKTATAPAAAVGVIEANSGRCLLPAESPSPD